MSEVRIGDSFNPAQLVPVEEGVDLSSLGQMSHLVDPVTKREYLRLEGAEYAPYPIPGDEDVIDYLLLPTTRVGENRYLHLPETYQTFSQTLEKVALNAARETGSSEDAIAEGDLLKETKKLFGQLGNQLDEVVLGDGMVPEDMHIRQVLVVEDEGELQIKLLPPLRLRSVLDKTYTPIDARTILLQQLYNSCWNAVTNQMIKDTLPAAFKGFTENFSLGRDQLRIPRLLGKNSVSGITTDPRAV